MATAQFYAIEGLELTLRRTGDPVWLQPIIEGRFVTDSVRRFSTTTAILLILTGAAWAADVPAFEERFEGVKPAVSGFNGKLDIGYLYNNLPGLPGDANGGYAIGSISAPLGERFGVQLDAGYMNLNLSGLPGDVELGGAGVHGFWRNPDVGLVGVYGHYVAINPNLGVGKVDSFRYGVEAEAYLGRVSIEGFVGADTLDGPAGIGDTFFNGQLRAGYYLTDNFRVDGGVLHQFDDTFGQVGFEAMLPVGSNMASLYANGTFGDSTTVRAGLRLYFGESGKSLMARHREDDPHTRLMDYFSLGGVARAPGGPGGGEEGGGGGEEGGGGNEGGGYPNG